MSNINLSSLRSSLQPIQASYVPLGSSMTKSVTHGSLAAVNVHHSLADSCILSKVSGPHSLVVGRIQRTSRHRSCTNTCSYVVVRCSADSREPTVQLADRVFPLSLSVLLPLVQSFVQLPAPATLPNMLYLLTPFNVLFSFVRACSVSWYRCSV